MLIGAAVVTFSASIGAQQPSSRSQRVDPSVATVISGGQWTSSDSSSGTFRIVVRIEGWEEVRHLVFVEWLEEDPDRHELRVRATRALDTLMTTAWSLDEPRLDLRAGHWYLTVRATLRPMAQPTRTLLFKLGRPGEIERAQSR